MNGVFGGVSSAVEDAAFVSDAVRLRQSHVTTPVEGQSTQRESAVDKAQLLTHHIRVDLGPTDRGRRVKRWEGVLGRITHLHAHTQTHLDTDTQTQTHTQTHIHRHAFTRASAHTHTHTHTHTDSWFSLLSGGCADCFPLSTVLHLQNSMSGGIAFDQAQILGARNWLSNASFGEHDTLIRQTLKRVH